MSATAYLRMTLEPSSRMVQSVYPLPPPTAARGLGDDIPRARPLPVDQRAMGVLVIRSGEPSLVLAVYAGLCAGLWIALVRMLGSSVSVSCGA
jgi:hypothetical protein